MEIILFLIALVRNIIPYFYLFKWKEDEKRSKIKAGISLVFIYAIYVAAINYTDLPNNILSLICITLPSLLILYCLTYYRDARLILTFTMIDNFSLITLFIVNLICNYLNLNIMIQGAIYLISFIGIYAWIRTKKYDYHNFLDTIEKGWAMVTKLSVVYYLVLYYFIARSNYGVGEVESIISSMAICGLIILSYITIFRTLSLSKEIYEIKDKEVDLTSQLKLQESQIKLKELYYKMAYEDGLTGLKNRTAYEEKLTEVQTKTRRNQKVWYISLDLNDLKITNDIQGHHKGDVLIKSTANALKITFIEIGHVFRIGGDEFVVIIQKEFTEIQLRDTLNELEQLLEEYGDATGLSIKVAWGCALYEPKETDTIVATAIRADEAMYAKKKRMKNKLSVC